MRFPVAAALSITLYGCMSYPLDMVGQTAPGRCPNGAGLPAHLCEAFEPVDDPALLAKSLGKPGKENLRQGRVYRSKKGSDVVVFPTWKSTYEGSKLGEWWTFDKPAGSISTFRKEYAICVEWSPIDMLVGCRLEPG